MKLISFRSIANTKPKIISRFVSCRRSLAVAFRDRFFSLLFVIQKTILETGNRKHNSPPRNKYYENTDFLRRTAERLIMLKSEYSASEGFLSLMNVETGFVTGTCPVAGLVAMWGSCSGSACMFFDTFTCNYRYL